MAFTPGNIIEKDPSHHCPPSFDCNGIILEDRRTGREAVVCSGNCPVREARIDALRSMDTVQIAGTTALAEEVVPENVLRKYFRGD